MSMRNGLYRVWQRNWRKMYLDVLKGNPSIHTGPELVKLIKKAANDPVLVMFDDSGFLGEGAGEIALKYVANHQGYRCLRSHCRCLKNKSS